MIEVNKLFGRELVIQDTGEKASKVQDIVFDERARQAIALLVSDGLLESTRVVRWGDIVSIKDVVVAAGGIDFHRLKDTPDINDLYKRKYRITNTEIIHSGEKIGTVGDIFIDGSGLVVGYEVKEGMLSSSRFLPVEQVESNGRDAIVTRTNDLPKLRDIKRG